MKRWFCGFVPESVSSLATLPNPIDGELLWKTSSSLWVCGSWKKQQIITLFEGSVRLAIIGTCLAPHETLAQFFRNAVKANEYSQLMRLPGSYNLIVQDDADTYVFVDAAGIKSAFYTIYNSCIVYSSLAIPLKQLLKAEVDKSWLATYLSGMVTLSLVQNRTPFCHVQPIPPGHYLHISKGKPICKRYWYGTQKYKSFSEAAEQLREELLTSVEGRVGLYGNITSDLSGGFDSTTLALIAAKTLAKQDKKLYTVTNKTVSATQSSDVEYAQHAASLYSNLNALMIEGDEIPTEYSNLELVPLTDAPSPVSLATAQILHRSKIISSLSSQLHMDGDGGDAVLSGCYSYCVDLLRQARIRKFFHHVYGWSRLGNFSPFTLMSKVIKHNFTSYQDWLFEGARKLKTGDLALQAFKLKQPIDQILGWDLLPEIASWHSNDSVNLVLDELQKWAQIATPFADSVGEHQFISILQLNGLNARIGHQLYEIYDVNLESPYLDTLVIDACLSANPEERISPFIYKPLLPKALHRDLPQSIFARNTKGDYTTDEFIGLRENRNIIKEIFQGSLLADMGLIKIRELENAMQHFNMGFFGNSPLFTQTLSLELWLRRLEKDHRSFWVEEN
ncbi:albusnodin/ikarugamycin family macrolactam cyclase [Anabaena sp. CCY 9402-a]|uniref:albusnodin/ikarugamycin family macrolactam cyclase n=1 Tax=Anabaena sp. CCY 9402-a TaxID=3103867 RepID=UPI0039C722BD